MSCFKSSWLSKSAGHFLHFTFKKAAMSSAGRQTTANDEDPWKVSAVVSALIELFLSVLLLLGAIIAFITTQLVNYFDLEPPCTYIGCSHTQLPKSTKRRRIDHGKEEHFFQLCPDCRASWGYTKQQNEKSQHIETDTETSSRQEGDDFSSNISCPSTSDVDVPHLDEETYVSPDDRYVERQSSGSSLQIYKNLKVKHAKSGSFNGSSIASQVAYEDCVPLFSTRSVSCVRGYKVKDCCEELATSMDKCRLPTSQVSSLQREITSDDTASLHHGNDEFGYMLLEDDDEEVYQDRFFDSFEAVSGGDDANGYLMLEVEDKTIFKTGKLRLESAQPLLPRDMDSISEEEKGLSIFIASAKASNICKDSEECIEPTCTVYAGEGERHYILLKADDEGTCRAPFIKELHVESAHPLLNNASDGESKVPNFFSMASNIDLLRDSPQASSFEPSMEDIPYHELAEVCIQTMTLEEEEHQYNLLENNDEDTLEVSNMGLHLDSRQLTSIEPSMEDSSYHELAEGDIQVVAREEEQHRYILLGDEDEVSSEAPSMVLHLDSCQLSGAEPLMEDSPYHEQAEPGIQTVAHEEEQHQYILLGNNDEDSSEAPDYENVLSDCMQPLLDGVQEGKSEALRFSLDLLCAKPAANVGDNHGADIKQLVEDNACCESPKASRVSSACKRFIQLKKMQVTEALLQGFSSDRGSGCLGPSSCDIAVVEGYAENDSYPFNKDSNLPLADRGIFEGLRRCKEIYEEEPLIVLESGSTAFGDLLGIDRLEVTEAFDCDAKIVIARDALLSKFSAMELHKQGRCPEECPKHEALTGLCIAELEKVWANNDKVSLRPHIVVQNEFYGKDLMGNVCASSATMVHDVYCFESREQLEKLDLSSLACFMTDDGTVAADHCSMRDGNANKVENTDITKTTLEASFETASEDTVSQPDLGFESCKQVEKDQVEGLDVDKEGFQADKDQVQSLDVLREALWAERKMLAALETELENERNAAATATSEAMAMISRLQEEKSAMQLEVAQLQRMAEEKAEYDEQAMALLKEILFKREAEKHALEKEVELYRERLSAEKVKKTENKGSSTWSPTSLLWLSRLDEDQGPFSPEGCNIRLKNLPSLDEFDKSECTSPPCPSKRQNMAFEESREHRTQFARPSEAGSLKGLRVNEQVDTSMVEDKRDSACSLTERLGTSRSIFSTNDEETQFILERLWVLEEELRELRGPDGLGAPKKSCELQNLDCSPAGKKSAGNVINSCNGREAAGHGDENGNGACLTVYDVYEVHSSQGQDNEGGNILEDREIHEDLKFLPRNVMHEEQLATIIPCDGSQVIPHARRLFPSNEPQCDSAIIANQVDDNVYAQFLKTSEGGVVSTDVIQQLAVRLHVLETDRELLREILESFRHKDAELKLLQEIAQQLRELRMFGFSSISTSVALQDPVSESFGKKNCARALKKRRYCSEPGQTELILLHQRSI